MGIRLQGGPAGAAATAPSTTVEYWQDAAATPAVPSDAATETAYPGRGLVPLQFAADTTAGRRIHVAVDDAYRIDLFSIFGADRSASFTARIASGKRIYDSAALAQTDAVDMLIRAVTA